jgi:hypothetical protein
VPDVDYRYLIDVAFTFRQPIIDAAPSVVMGRIGLDDDGWHDYESALEFNFDARGHTAGDVYHWGESGSGRAPAGALGIVMADLSSDDGFSDHVENDLLATPEPATVALVGTGLLALTGLTGATRARQRRAGAGAAGSATLRPARTGAIPS